MAIISKKDVCVHNLFVQERSGVNVVNVKPLFNQDSQNIIIACGTVIKVFAIKSGKCIHTLKYHSGPVISLRENKLNILQIYSCSDDGVVVRWDYTGKLLQVYDLQMPVTNFYVPSPTGEWFVTRKYEDQYRLYSVVPKKEGFRSVHMILKPVLSNDNSIAFGLMGKYIASIHENNLTIYKSDTKSIIRHKTGERKLTCVVCHPTDFVIATGDDHGRVIVWSNAVESNHPIRSIYHWHTLPVADLAFSPEGSHLLSGGGEAALVKWNLFSEERAILPRMGAPIVHVVASKDNNYVLTIHSDNVLQVVDAQRNVVQVIQGLTRSEPLYGKLLPAGLTYNAHLKTLVMNGKPGHLQFYDIAQEKLLYNLDVVARNFLTGDRDSAVYNMDVQGAAADDRGLWLATTEYWCSPDVRPRVWLKFWRFDPEEQTFALNTNVLMPHDRELVCMLFRPGGGMVLTVGQDRQLKTWNLVDDRETHGKQSWAHEHEGHYKDLTPGSASFSEDGSVVAVAFGRAATLWDAEGLVWKERLFSPGGGDIRQLLFGRRSGFKYLLGHDGHSITAWDCLTLTVSWIVHAEVQLLVTDGATGRIAAFCEDQNLKIFLAESPVPFDCVERASDRPVVCAAFVPSDRADSVAGCFQDESRLFFVDEDQNLLTLTHSEEGPEPDLHTGSVAPNLGYTPFGKLRAARTVSDVKQEKSAQFVVPEEEEEADIISNPTWQDMRALFHALVPGLLIPREKNGVEDPDTVSSSVRETADEAESPRVFEDEWRAKALDGVFKPEILDLSGLGRTVEFAE